MKNLVRFLTLVAFAVMPIVGRAQVAYENFTSTVGNVSLNGFSAVQTFTGFSSLSSMTWSVTNIGGNFGSTTTFNAYIAEWTNPTMTTSTTALQFGDSALISGIATDDFVNLTFAPGSALTLTPSLTYALILSDTTGSTDFSATRVGNPGGAFFGTGGAGTIGFSVASIGGDAAFQLGLELSGTGSPGVGINGGFAYAMSATGILAATPAPEPKTAAAGIGALFIAGLVGRRVWQRRQPQAMPVPIAA